MKLHEINKLLKLPQKLAYTFLKYCKVTEKIDSHYVKVKILGPGNISCNRGAGNVLTLVDCIINAMWAHFIEDFNILKNNNEFYNFCKKYQGCILNFFYIPCRKPLETLYNLNGYQRLYVLSQCYNTITKEEVNLDETYTDFEKVLNDQYFKSAIGTRANFMKQYYFNVKDINGFFDKLYDNDFSNIEDVLDVDTNKILNNNKLDKTSLIFSNKKKFYQINYETHEYNQVSQEYTSYEFVMVDFLNFWKTNYDWLIHTVRGTYRNIVCTLFNEYILNWEKDRHYLRDNIQVDAIVPPKSGYDHGDSINPVYVPNKITLKLCEDPLYKNVFKILIVNLQIFKTYKYCVYMTKEQFNEFYEIVQIIHSLKSNYNESK